MTERHIRMDGDRWKVRLGRESSRPGVRAVLFFPVTTSQRPYRVVEVDEDRIGTDRDLEMLSERELEELFADSRSMGYPRSYA